MHPTEFYIYRSAIGTLLLIGSQGALHYATIAEDRDTALARQQEIALHAEETTTGFLTEVAANIEAYLRGEAPLNVTYSFMRGTALQRRVWEEIARIPHGQTISYTELAARVGKPKAVRAAASACGANPILLVVPCHRVLGKGGHIGGYSGYGGLDLKRRLLALEAGDDWRRAVAA